MPGEIYAAECCGAAFVPGHGPDNIIEAKDDDTADARRQWGGLCPSCGARDPALYLIRGYDE